MQNAVNEIEDLPRALVAAITGGQWITPNAARLREITRAALHAQHAGLPMEHVMTELAAAARRDMPVSNTDWTPEMRRIEDLIWPFLASATAMRCTRETANEHGAPNSPEETLAVVRRIIADETRKATIDPGEADRLIRAEMERVSGLHPELGLSYGYIGNIWHSPRHDDRSFRIFTTLRDARGYSVSFGGHSHDCLGELALMVERRLQPWAQEQSSRLSSREVHDVRANLPMAA